MLLPLLRTGSSPSHVTKWIVVEIGLALSEQTMPRPGMAKLPRGIRASISLIGPTGPHSRGSCAAAESKLFITSLEPSRQGIARGVEHCGWEVFPTAPASDWSETRPPEAFGGDVITLLPPTSRCPISNRHHWSCRSFW